MSRHLHTETTHLKRKILQLGAIVEDAVQRAVLAFLESDIQLANQVIEHDRKIDLFEVEIEEDCLKVLALHQPVAIDLRFVVSVLKMDNDIERIGDLAVNIAERAIMVAKHPQIPPPFHVQTMAQQARLMLRGALDAMVNKNIPLARQISNQDDEIDEMNRRTIETIHELIKKHPEHTEPYLLYLSVSRLLERLADYATNICEDVVYMVEGTIVRHRKDFKVNP
jgi:phosphate transport system protein